MMNDPDAEHVLPSEPVDEPVNEPVRDPVNVLSGADTTWLQSILLDAEDNDATVTLNVPMHPTAHVAEYEEIIEFNSSTPAYLHEAARNFAEACVRYVRDRDAYRTETVATGEVRCVTCTGACCARVFNEVNVTEADIEVMGLELAKRGVDLYPHGQGFNGYVGTLKRTSWQGEGEAAFEADERPMACVFLSPKTSLCTIYDKRPLICKEHTSFDCDVKEEAPQKLITLRRKMMKIGESTP